MYTKLKKIIDSTESNNTHRPEFFRLSNYNEKKSFLNLIDNNPYLKIYDKLHGQLEELVKLLSPKTIFNKHTIAVAAKEYLGNNVAEEYGVWVYYPWSERIIHLLDEKEFISVRTNRNQYKITKEEHLLLSEKKIGIVGISIGHSIALTMALERIFGEIRLADFDVLELSNYNRIRTGIHNLGLHKVIAAAREISEIDPFLKVTCFQDGLNEYNIDDFLYKGGKLNLLIEVCDGLDVKIFAREKAKANRIPLIMDTSDRGMVDIERYDLEPDREILHGLVSHLDLTEIKNLKTNEEKVPYLLPIVGLDTISDRSKASMIEVGNTITTWPQLASSVTLGGGVTTDISRRILIDTLRVSGRFFVDIEELICDKKEQEQVHNFSLMPSISEDTMLKEVLKFNTVEIEGQLDLSDETITELITSATLAPSGANSQSWKFFYHKKHLYLFLDILYTAGLLDYQNTTSYIGIGTAAENLIIKAQSLGLAVMTVTPDLFPDSKLIVAFKFFSSANNINNIEPTIDPELEPQIYTRITNRTLAEKRIPIEKSKFDELVSATKTFKGADLKLVLNAEDLDEASDIIAICDRLRVMDPGGHQDFLAEIRWSQEEAEHWKNGIDLLGTVQLTPSEHAGFMMAKHKEVISLLKQWDGGKSFEKLARKQVGSASAVGLILMPEYNSKAFYEGGRVVERVWLKANSLGIAFHPLSIPTLMFNRLIHGGEKTIDSVTLTELKEVRKKFERLFNLESKTMGEIMLFRLFIGNTPKRKSVRYDLDTVLKILR